MKSLELNPHVLQLKESSTLAINEKSKALREQRKTIYHWGFGQSPFPIAKPIQNALVRHAHHKEYLPTQGLLQLRSTITEFYRRELDLEFSTDQVFIGPGSKELIFQLLYLLQGHVIIPAPSWVSYEPQINIKGHKTSILITKPSNNYKMTPEQLDEFCKTFSANQKTLILNSPSNPSGQYYTDVELESLAPVLTKHNIIVISDEIYGQVNFKLNQSPSLAKYYPERTIITGGLSKAHSAGGYRLGYMLIPTTLSDILNPMKAMISETFSAVASPIQYAAIKAWDFTKEVEDEVRLCTQIHKACGEYVYKFLIKLNIQTPPPCGAFYLFISFDYYRSKLENLNILNSPDLCNYILDKFQIALLPGDDFYYPAESLTARLAFVDYDGEKVLAAAKNTPHINEDFVE
ncbi:MAG: aminotransferase class I/II-fold pyridoxal phosphate-dependent enzyme, partial [Halobacteriovoraceae bacterium]|nr:aminotransferase class I/II-fold pyridoxal phosphate-dependent enzyme [Halobacteriovoraceae bacterium]